MPTNASRHIIDMYKILQGFSRTANTGSFIRKKYDTWPYKRNKQQTMTVAILLRKTNGQAYSTHISETSSLWLCILIGLDVGY
jgi:hypothetical protein